MKYLAHFSWCFLCLATAILFILGAIFGLAGTASKDLPPIIEYLFSEENLYNNKIVFNDDLAIRALDTCMNKGGNLSEIILNGSDLGIGEFESFYTAAAQIDNTTRLVKANRNSEVISSITNDFNSLKLDITETRFGDANSPSRVLNELRKYTDRNIDGVNSRCTTSKTQDLFVQTKEKCLSTYQYVSGSDPTQRIGQLTCLLYPEFSNNAISRRYESSPSGCTVSGDFNSVISAVQAYVTALNRYTVDNSNELTKLNSELAK